MKKFKIFLIFILFLTPSFSLALTTEEIVAKIEKSYNSLKDLSVDFDKTWVSDYFKKEKKSEGKMYLKNPDKYRIEGTDEEIVSDGKIVWIYSKENQQVIINWANQSKNVFKPNQIFLNFKLDYNIKLLGEEKIEKVSCYNLELTPKNENASITKMLLWVDKKSFLAKKIAHTDQSDNQTILLFKNFKRNQGLKNSKFVYKIPKGIEKVDMRKEKGE